MHLLILLKIVYGIQVFAEMLMVMSMKKEYDFSQGKKIHTLLL